MLAPTDRKGNNPKPELRPHVTSHSYGGGGQGRSQLENVVQPCLDAGVHVVVAAHNYARCRSVTDPGIIPTVLTCGALGDRTDNIASFSSKGPGPAAYNNTLKPEISAPGTNIISALGGSMNYGSKSGTSMSTPLIAGSIALLWDAVPALNRNIKRTNEVLYQTANHQRTRDCESPKDTPNNVYGYGTINVLKAYELATKLYGNK
jgi:subtilisin family serine protease